jgi:hypothetical protein
MAKTKNQMAQDVMTELGEDTGTATLVTLFEGFVQRVYDDVGSEARWSFQFAEEDITTVASTETYGVAIDVHDISSMRIDPTDEQVEFKSRDDLVRAGVNMDEEGRPRFWYDAGFDATTSKQQISFWPIPDAVYTVEVHTQGAPAQLATGDTLPVPNEFLSLIFEGVLALGYRHEKDWDSYDRTYANYALRKEKLRRRYAHRVNAFRKLQVTDVPRRTDTMKPVRLPPSHFSNSY